MRQVRGSARFRLSAAMPYAVVVTASSLRYRAQRCVIL